MPPSYRLYFAPFERCVVTVVAGRTTVVRHVDDKGVLPLAAALEAVEDPADLAVHDLELREVVGAPILQVRGDGTVVPVHVLLDVRIEVRSTRAGLVPPARPAGAAT